MLNDVLYALRSIGKKPLFYAVATLTLALGIGANAAIFTVVNAVLLQPLPYPQPDQLMMLWTYNPRQGFDKDVGTYPNFEDWRRASQSFARMSAYSGASMTLTGSGDPVQLRGSRVTHDFFDTLAVAPARGRAFTAANGQTGGERIAILAHGLWTRRFGADPSIVGRTIVLNGASHEVLGVMPESFAYPGDAEFWVPLAPVGPYEELLRARGSYWLTIVGRLKPGVTREAAQSEMDAIAARLEQEYPVNAGIGIRLVPMHEEIVGDVKRPLWILLGAVYFVLLIACTNVANLLLTRAASRQRELAIRSALGAGRGRLLRQMLTESVLLGLIGGAAGLLLAAWCADLLQTLAPAGLPRLSTIAVDRQVIGYAVVASMLTGLLFGIVPALHAARRDSGANLKEGGRTGTDSVRGRRVRAALAIGELAVALVLLVGAGLLVRTIVALNSQDPGFASTGVLTLRLDLPQAKYTSPERVTAFYDQLIERLSALPGVESAGAGSSLLLSRLPASATLSIEGRPPLPRDAQNIPVPYRYGHVRLLRRVADPAAPRTDVHAGRHARGAGCRARQRIVRQAVLPERRPARAPRHVRESDAAGHPVADDRRSRCRHPARRVRAGAVGGNLLPDATRDRTRACSYFYGPPEYRRACRRRTGGRVGARSRPGDCQHPHGAQSARAGAGESAIHDAAARPLCRCRAGIAAIGVYGVLAFLTAQRTQEIGIRMALGADRAAIQGMVFASSTKIAAIGLRIGIASAALR